MQDSHLQCPPRAGPKTFLQAHLVREGSNDARQDVLGEVLGLLVWVADARGQLAEGYQPHIHGQAFRQALHDCVHL